MTWTISNLCRGKPAPPLEQVVAAFPYLLARLQGNDPECQADACWAVSYVSDGEKERINAVLEADFLPPIMEILGQQTQQPLQSTALGVVGNILLLLIGDEHHTQALLDTTMIVLPHLLSLLSHPKKKIQKEACRVISNITAGTLSQIQAVIDCGIFPTLIRLANVAEYDIRKECVLCLFNAIEQGSPKQVQYLVSLGILQFLATLLDTNKDQQLIPVYLTAIHNILKSNIGEFSSLVIESFGQRIRRYESGSDNHSVHTIVQDIVALLPNLPEYAPDDGKKRRRKDQKNVTSRNKHSKDSFS